jgi:hypothetical protein
VKHIFFIAVFFLHFVPVFTQTRDYKQAEDYLEERGEVYFSFCKQSPQAMKRLTRIISLDRVMADTVYAYANINGFSRFLDADIDYTVLPPPAKQYNVKTGSRFKSDGAWNFYPTYPEYVNIMESFVDSFPELCVLDTIGYSVNKRKILFLKISGNAEQGHKTKPKFMYSSTMHGDETTGYILLLQLIDHLLNGYGSDVKITRLINNVEIWINPLANPDGTYFGGDSTVNEAKRYNLNNVDLNRNFPDPEDGMHPDNNDWQPENIAMMNFMEKYNFVLSANLHGGAEVINYPWDTWHTRHADDQWFRYISRQYADTVHKYAPEGYLTDLENGVTNGYDWYSISGGRQDYVTYYQHGREVTMELSQQKLPPPEDLPKYWNYNYRALINYMEQSLFGLTGIVTDSLTGDPLKAKIYLPYHDKDSSWVYSDAETGVYHRLLYENNYDLQAAAAGYPVRQIKNISIANHYLLNMDIQLTKPVIPPPKKINDYSLSISPNPFCRNPIISIGIAQNTPVKLTLFDTKGREIGVLINEYFVSGFYELSWDVSNLVSGMYFLCLETGNKIFTKKAIKINKNNSTP